MVKKICLSIVIGIVLIVTLPKFVNSDDYPLLNFGYTVFPIKQHDIQMVKEVVKITPSMPDWKNYPFMLMKTEATFVFKNTSDKKIELEMGFPFGEGTRCEPFTTTINGQKIKVSKIDTRNDKVRINSKYSYNYTWSITFKPNEQKIVQNIYYCREIDQHQGSSEYYVNYITKSGSLWKGSIKQADFYIAIPPRSVTPIDYQELLQKLSESPRRCYNHKGWEICRTIKPSGYKIVNGHIEWHFKNWKPSEDILVVIGRK